MVRFDNEWEDVIVSGMKIILNEQPKTNVFIMNIPLDKFTKEEIIKIFASWTLDKVPVFTDSTKQ
jgi:hypothetical protein